MTPRILTSTLVTTTFATLLAIGTVGCASDASKTEPSRRAVLNARAPIAAYRSQLDQIRPRIDATIASASDMLAKADSDPKGAISAFTANVNRLKGDAETMRAQVDDLKRLGFDQYFLGADQKTAISSDPAVLAARENYGLVGDYMVSLRDTGTRTLAQLEAISTAVNANPTAAGIRSQSNAIGRLQQSQIELNSVINLLTSSIDKMPRA